MTFAPCPLRGKLQKKRAPNAQCWRVDRVTPCAPCLPAVDRRARSDAPASLASVCPPSLLSRDPALFALFDKRAAGVYAFAYSHDRQGRERPIGKAL